MKNKIKGFLLLILLIVTSCTYLDKQPDDMKTDKMVWESRTEVEHYLANIYAAIPYHYWHSNDPWVGMSDECDLSWNVYFTYPVNIGNWDKNGSFYVKWDTYYKAIRSSFVFENNVGRCDELSGELKNRYSAEAKFLRGYYYWLLVQQYGPVPLFKELPSADFNWNGAARDTFDDCIAYICQMMDESAAGLPLHWQNDNTQMGRSNKIVCMSVKSIALTTAASPQWNGNKDYINFKNNDGTLLVNPIYSTDKWKAAAAASKDVINLAENNLSANVKLYRNDENGDGEFNPYKSLHDAIIVPWNCEWIWGRIASDVYEAWMIHAACSPNNLGGIGPTQRLVDAFLMKNGKPITDPNSEFVAEGFATKDGEHFNPNRLNMATDRVEIIKEIRACYSWGHAKGDWNEYANREPRFYTNVMYNKRIIPYLPDDMEKRNYYNKESQQNGYARAELYMGGLSGLAAGKTFYSKTGYLSMKYCDHQANMRDRVFPRKYGMIYIRYATILLNYIEALNEYEPTHPDIRKYWDMIRSRAGVPSAFVATPEIVGDKEKQLDFILRERQIELAMETDRYFTTRRRWLAHTPDTGDDNDVERKFGDGGRQWGLSYDEGSESTNDFSYTGFYKKKSFEMRVFKKQFYLFPIPQTEIEKAPGLVQNPWW